MRSARVQASSVGDRHSGGSATDCVGERPAFDGDQLARAESFHAGDRRQSDDRAAL